MALIPTKAKDLKVGSVVSYAHTEDIFGTIVKIEFTEYSEFLVTVRRDVEDHPDYPNFSHHDAKPEVINGGYDCMFLLAPDMVQFAVLAVEPDPEIESQVVQFTVSANVEIVDGEPTGKVDIDLNWNGGDPSTLWTRYVNIGCAAVDDESLHVEDDHLNPDQWDIVNRATAFFNLFSRNNNGEVQL